MPELIDRRALLAGTGAALLASGAGLAQQPWPQGRQVKLVVPFTPGGATDVLGRLAADKLSQSWGNVVVVENRPGAGSNIGIEAVAKAEPNGDTLLIASVGLATNRYLYAKVNYDPVRDLAPITMVALVPNLLVVRNDLPVKNVAELVAYAKANPGKLTYASSGVGTSLHLSGELFQKLTGTKMVHVPYRGSSQAIQDLMGGRVDLIFDNITSALPQAKGGAIRGLGVTTAKRAPTAPEYPPIGETVPGFDVSSWFALFAPAKTPQAIIDKIQADTKAGLADPALRAKMDALAAEPGGWTPAELAAFLQAELKKWGDLIQEAGIKAE
ncbi:tripartite-type tricarboxylate transporter receptor subunit TctC [Bosea sp. OAE752]|jgi:tripartite-type tricarboxylate transporter receptor subunit TctC|uniref:Tripartite tricarboxylate transporter substrate binding protein n=1 Tax=Bosea spartocytisi TaxID=2773451 RepID=A0A927ECM3_9HYPH|nr:tripartite tricarboxylate transporter substrate binding protein [Bosea spartocytisi]MBD3848364.1 tripartite tricarboxylate transporter substrate binding protein [Bosea spartocytisi]MCT4474831.1 tripartite tricarboxylate transporter substrate binding protein [Bosea spartocytisi]